MKKTYKIILWMIFYIFTVIMIYNEYAKYSEVPSVNDFLENTLFKIQHILFTINIFFIILLTVVKIPIFSPNFIIRYKNHIIEVIFIQGVKLAVFFTSVTSAAYILPSLLLGNSLILKPELFIFIAGILSFVLSVYIEYVTRITSYNVCYTKLLRRQYISCRCNGCKENG